MTALAQNSIKHLGFCLTVMLISIALFGCADSTQVTRLETAAAVKPEPVRKLMVIAIAQTPAQRTEIENDLLAQLEDYRVDASASHMSIGQTDPVTNESIKAASQREGHDSVLVTRISNSETTFERKEGRTDVVATCRRGDPYDPFLYDYEEYTFPNSVEFSQSVTVVTGLYRARDGELMWAIESKCYDKHSMFEALLEQAATIVEALADDGWLK